MLPIQFKIRFNTTHGDTNLFWRIIVDNTEHLAAAIDCKVPTRSDASFDERAGVIKYHIAGECESFYIDDNKLAIFK